MALAVGIDLGTTNSVVAVATPTGVEFALGAAGERIHPSVVSFPPDGGIAIGVDAKNLRADYPTTTIYSAKRLIGQNVRSPLVQLALTGLPFTVEEGANQQPIVVVGERRLTVPEVSAHVLGHLKQCAQRQLGQAVSDAVITVPANFTDAQRQATKEAGRLAGLNVLRLLNEPTAAALAYGFGQHKDETVCVFDFGGGTFDVSLLAVKDEVFEVLATDGDFFLGGDDVDRAIAEFLAAEVNRQLRLDPRRDPGLMARLTMAAEQIKIHLSEVAVAEGTIDGLTYEGRALALPFRLTRVQLEDLIRGYVDRTIELTRNVLTTANLPPQAITEVVCVGGSTRIPLVRRRLAELFGREPALRINPDEVVAQGAAAFAAVLTGSDDDAALLDVTPHDIGIKVGESQFSVIIPRNSMLPVRARRVFATTMADQKFVQIELYQGDSNDVQDNRRLGMVVLDDLPPGPAGSVRVELILTIDVESILSVTAREPKSGKQSAVTIRPSGGLSQRDLVDIIARRRGDAPPT